VEERKVTVGTVQMACETGKQANIRKAVSMIRKAAGAGAQIVCLQEIFATRYFCQGESYENFDLAEPVPGPTTSELGKLAEELNVVIIASLFEKRTNGIYHNTTAVIDAGGKYLGKYRKQHIPDDPGFYEKFYFTPGDKGYQVFETKFAKIGVLVCWDQWYPEAARITALMGAEILFYPTAIGWASSQDEETNETQYRAWQTIQRSHAIANGIFVVSVNRTGTEDDLEFWGGSMIVGPFGELLYEAPHAEEVVHAQEIDLEAVNKIRVHWPFLRDRRIDTYKPITNRFLDD
jgi:N-carbamoylputrescine amidase